MHYLKKNKIEKTASGVSFAAFFIGVLLIFAIVIPLMRAMPSLKEYWAIKNAVRKAAAGAISVEQAREMFLAQIPIDNIRAIDADDLIITQVSGKISISFKYQQPIPLYGPVSLLINYEDTAQGVSVVN